MNWITKATITVKKFFDSSNASRFRQNFLKVAKANVFAQIISFSLAPLLSRLYLPADYGTVALFVSLLNLFSAFATWRFDWSVPNTGTRSQAAALLVLGLIVLLFVSFVSFFVLWLFAGGWTFWKGFHDLGPLLLLLPLALVGTGVRQLMQAWFIRENDLSAVSKSTVTQSVVGTSINVTAGVVGLGALGLIISSLVSVWVSVGILLGNAIGLRSSLVKVSVKRIKLSGLRFGKESSVSTAVALTNIAGLAATPVLLAQYYSVSEIGWYAFMYRLAVTPVGLFTGALGQSFWSEAAKLVNTDRIALKKLYLRTTKYLALIACPISLLCICGPVFVGPLFGEHWRGAGYILAALAPFVAAQVTVQPITHLVVHRKQHWKLFLDAWKLILTLALIIVLANQSVKLHLLILSLSLLSVAMHLILFFLNLRCLTR